MQTCSLNSPLCSSHFSEHFDIKNAIFGQVELKILILQDWVQNWDFYPFSEFTKGWHRDAAPSPVLPAEAAATAAARVPGVLRLPGMGSPHLTDHGDEERLIAKWRSPGCSPLPWIDRRSWGRRRTASVGDDLVDLAGKKTSNGVNPMSK